MVNNEEKEQRKKGFAWWWLLVPIVAVGVWYFYPKSSSPSPSTPAEVVSAPVSGTASGIKICYQPQTMNPAHCCTEDLSQVSIFESSNVVYATVNLTGKVEKNAVVTGIVQWQTGENFPTQPIQFEANELVGDGCYVGRIKPVNGVLWSLHKYVLKLQVNGQPAGEREFEMVR